MYQAEIWCLINTHRVAPKLHQSCRQVAFVFMRLQQRLTTGQQSTASHRRIISMIRLQTASASQSSCATTCNFLQLLFCATSVQLLCNSFAMHTTQHFHNDVADTATLLVDTSCPQSQVILVDDLTVARRCMKLQVAPKLHRSCI